MPLFPTQAGARVKKVDAVSTIIELASRMGQPTICPTSHGQFLGGHSMRTGGAQALAGLGVDPIRIQTMGRWKSALVIRYSGAKGACGITRDAARGLLEGGFINATPAVAAVPITIGSINNALSVADLDIQTVDLETDRREYDMSHAHKTLLVENSTSGVIHKFVKG